MTAADPCQRGSKERLKLVTLFKDVHKGNLKETADHEEYCPWCLLKVIVAMFSEKNGTIKILFFMGNYQWARGSEHQQYESWQPSSNSVNTYFSRAFKTQIFGSDLILCSYYH